MANPTRQQEQEVIREFGEAKQKKLDVHRKKGRMAWANKTDTELFELLRLEVEELWQAIVKGNSREILKECADVSNFAMFIWYIRKQKK